MGSILKDVVKIAQRRNEHTKRVFKDIFKNCTDQMRRAASTGQMFLLYTVPAVKIGLPAYDADEATRYVSKSLKRRGFEVEQSGKRDVLIDWKALVKRLAKDSSKEARSRRQRTESRPKKKRKPVEMPLPPLCSDPNDLFAINAINKKHPSGGAAKP